MILPTLFCDGVRLPITERIGRGGEGEVYALADGSNRAVKVYFSPDAARAAKVQAIVKAGLSDACRNAAFPIDVVTTADGKFAGFTMERVQGHLPIYELTGTASRRQRFAHADWRFLVRVARNVAGIMATLHKAGVVIGDINSAGFLVSQQATVTLIDADSFQIGPHRCRVGMPEYSPPELQCKRFDESDRTANHDAFGLAVLLFQILALGRHPFAGVASGRAIAIDAAIAQGRFCYTLIRKVSGAPPPATIGLADFPAGIRLLFERAFAPRIGARPSAVEWVAELIRLENELAACVDQPAHMISTLATPCPWCRIERQTGRPIFIKTISIPPMAIPILPIHDRVHSAIELAKTHAGEQLTPMWSRPEVIASKSARKLLASEGSPGPLQALRLRLGIDTGSIEKFIDRYNAAQAGATSAMNDWRTRLGVWDISQLIDDLRGDLAKLDRIALHRPVLLAQASASLIERETRAKLSTVPIRGTRIPGIGNALFDRLGAEGIISVADVTRARLEAVNGIGESRIVALLFCRDALAVAVQRAVSDSDQVGRMASAERMVDDLSAKIRTSVQARIAALDTIVARIRKRVWLVDVPLQDAFRARDQAEADLKYLGIDEAALRRFATPPMSAPTSPARATKSKSKKPKKPAQTCPRCGAPMVKRWSNGAAGQGRLFRGCSTYPRCSGSRPIHNMSAKP